MTAIWKKSQASWELMKPAGFPAEKALHDLIADAPQLLPLSGQPQLAVVGKEVALGSNYADVIAIETTGRPVVVEVKLAQNAEARRAVVAQVLTYAAHMYQLTPADFATILSSHLRARGFETLADAARGADQSGAFDVEDFERSLADHLQAGSFRLVLVLDSVPEELVRLVGYLENVTDKLVVDLVTVSMFDVNGSSILVPQRVQPERLERVTAPDPGAKAKGVLSDGPEDFIASIPDASTAEQAKLRQLADWAAELKNLPSVRLQSYRGLKGIVTLLPRLQPDDAGLISILNDRGRAYVSLWRNVFERRAPKVISEVEELIQPTPLGQGHRVSTITPQRLAALRRAYEEANASSLKTSAGT